MLKSVLEQQWFGNTIQTYLFALLFLLIGLSAVWVAKFFVLARLRRWTERTRVHWDDMLVSALQETGIPLAYLSVFFAAIKSLHLPPMLSKVLAVLWATIVMIAVVRVVLRVLNYAFEEIWFGADARPEIKRTSRSFMPIINGLVWGLGIVLLLDNLGFKITAVVAGLGIGGIAVALAAQTVLGDLFAYVAIMLDRPFEIDDFIIVGSLMGTVERVGIKTTRVRSLSGEELIFANKDLTDSRIQNFKRMQLRRIEFNLGVIYDTATVKLREGIGIVRDAITSTADTRFDRAHFSAFGAANLGIQAVYFVLSADYNKYMDVQQEIYLKIKDGFERAGIAFAFPTQTIELKNPPGPRTP